MPTTEDYVAMAREILRKVATHRGVVLCVARLAAHDGTPLIDCTLETPQGAHRPRLKNPPAHLSTRDVYEVESPRHGRLHHAWVLSNEQSTFPVGGMLFVPSPPAPDLTLVTFNVGPLDTSDRARCRNAHHAEIQLTTFVEAQSARWRGQLGTIRLANRSRQGAGLGYSPCNACCADLATFLGAVNRLPRPRPVAATISWERRYDRGQICGHDTNEENLRRLETSGWTLDRPRVEQETEVPALA